MTIKFTPVQKKHDTYRFGGNSIAVWERDNYCCVNCGMSMGEHINKYNKRLTINHINGLGRNSGKPDNRMENLETLCLPCHGKADCQNKKWILKMKK